MLLQPADESALDLQAPRPVRLTDTEYQRAGKTRSVTRDPPRSGETATNNHAPMRLAIVEWLHQGRALPRRRVALRPERARNPR